MFGPDAQFFETDASTSTALAGAEGERRPNASISAKVVPEFPAGTLRSRDDGATSMSGFRSRNPARTCRMAEIFGWEQNRMAFRHFFGGSEKPQHVGHEVPRFADDTCTESMRLFARAAPQELR